MSTGVLTIMEMNLKKEAISDNLKNNNFIYERCLISRKLRKVVEYLNRTVKLFIPISEFEN